jgi:hypothetical protein
MKTRVRFKTECKKWRASEDAMNDETTPAFAHHLVPVLFAPAVVNGNAFVSLDSVFMSDKGKLLQQHVELINQNRNVPTRQTNCMTRMISRDYHFRYHSAYYIVYHRFLPKTYTKLFSIKGCCFCCCCFQCNFPYLIVGIRAWFAGYVR